MMKMYFAAFSAERLFGLLGTSVLDVTFAVPGDVPAGGYRVRLRVDGADSVHVDRTTTPPSFNAPSVTLPA